MITLNIKTLGGVRLTTALRSYVEKKVSHLEKFMEGSRKECIVMVEVGKSTKHHHLGDVFKAEIRVQFGRKRLVAVVEEEDLYAAIDKMKDEISQEFVAFRKRKSKLERKGARVIKKIIHNQNASESASNNAPEDEDNTDSES